jgi:hypothetical protein
VGLARLEGEAQRLAGPEQVVLAYELLERARAQPVGKRSLGVPLGKEVIH